MAKSTKTNVAKSKPVKAVKPVESKAKKVAEKKSAGGKEKAGTKKAEKPIVKKAPVKAVAAKKQVPPKPVAKPAPKAPVKIASKPAVKVAPKPVVKATPKPAVKATPKPAVKATPKPAVKAAPKPAVKAAPKPAVKATLKPAVKAAPKPAVKAAPKPAVKTATKPVVKAAPKPAPKAEVKVVPKTAEKVAPKPAAKADKTKTKPDTVIEKIIKRTPTQPPEDLGEVTIEKKLIALYNLQQIDSQVDKIRIIRGELPLEVQDLEDEIAGLETRIENYIQETHTLDKSVTEKKFSIKDSQTLIKKYEDQQMNVRNNREYDSLTKEIEIQSLEIQLAEKRIREFQTQLESKKEEIDRFQKILSDRKNDLEIKKNELDDIVAETEKEENDLIRNSEINRKFIEERLITAYTRIRKNARNGLAVVQIERDACGGCFNKIPPQHQLDIRMRKKIIVCEYCGRILVDDGIVNTVQ